MISQVLQIALDVDVSRDGGGSEVQRILITRPEYTHRHTFDYISAEEHSTLSNVHSCYRDRVGQRYIRAFIITSPRCCSNPRIHPIRLLVRPYTVRALTASS